MSDQLPYLVEPMTLDDLDDVARIERAAFSLPWPTRSYRYEITENEYSTMLVVRAGSKPGKRLARYLPRFSGVEHSPVLGYAGFWLLMDDAHIATIAVHPQWRGRGLGELLLLSLLDRAVELNAFRATLEVRVSNHVAQNLYYKYDFAIISRRRHYYADNNEDAYIMATPSFEVPPFQAKLHENRVRLYARLRAEDASEGVVSTGRRVD
jgi:ribosomal-protein-alanine N-acetyltransferase